MKFTKHQILELVIILLFGLIPLLWFRGNQVILGHDSGLTISPVIHFFDRLYAWTNRFAFGVDQTYAIPGFFIHGFEALLGVFGFSLQNVQKISFIFWFVLPGICMYILGRKIEKKYALTSLAFPATLFYMINHFLLQAWFVAERTKFSLYAALPLLVLFLIDWKDKSRSTLKTSIYISLLFFFLNGEASIPLFGGIILTLFIFLLFYFLKKISWKSLRSLFVLFILTGSISFLLQAYWLIPYGYYITHNYSKEVSVAGGLSGILSWIKYISENSSLSNLFRLQGIPEWYQNPLHPYAKEFLTNPFLIVVSYLLPVLAFLPLFLFRKRKEITIILFFVSLALLSIVFMAGSHPPFGPLYVFLVKFVPGFIAFRTPFYKFASSLWFAYALLLGFSISYFVTTLKEKNIAKTFLLYILFPLVIAVYNYPYFSGIFFDYIYHERTMKVSVPKYVTDFGEWSMLPENRDKKTLLLPPPSKSFKVDAYDWGYWSLAPVTSLLTNAPLITLSYYGKERENKFLSLLYQKMENNDRSWVNIAQYLGISRVLLRNDFAWNLKESPTTDPKIYDKVLKDSQVSMTKEFGKWQVYTLNHQTYEQAKAVNSLGIVMGEVEGIDQLVALSDFSSHQVDYFSEDEKNIPEEILRHANRFYSYPECINCNLQYSFQQLDLSPPLLTRSSKLYPLVGMLDQLDSKGEINEEYYVSLALRDALGYKDMLIKGINEKYILLSLKDIDSDLSKFNKLFLLKKDSYTNNQLMQLENKLRIIVLVLDGEKNKISSNDLQEKVFKTIALVQSYRQLVSKNMWETTKENQFKYLVNIPKDGEYTMIYTTDNPNNPLEITMDGEVINQSLVISNNSLEIHNVPLKSGKHKLLIKDAQHDEFANNEEVILPQSNCFTSPAIPLDAESFYRLNYVYKTNKKNSDLRFTYNQKHAAMPKGVEQLSSEGNFKNYEKDFATTVTDSMVLSFCNDSKENADVQIKQIAFRKIRIPKVLFYQKKDGVNISSQVAVDKINPTRYQLSVAKDNPSSIVVLNESFSPQWELSDSLLHFEANGYANGWVVKDINVFQADYLIQKLVWLGFSITGITLVVLSFIIYLLRKL